MKRKSILIIMTLILVLSIILSNYINKDILNDTLTTLTSDSFMGRLVGNEGNEKAVEYIEKEFNRINLQSFNVDSYLDAFDMITYNAINSDIKLEVKLKNSASYYCTYGEDFMEQSKLTVLDLSAPITFDMTDPEIKNKILVLENSAEIKKVINKVKGILIKTILFKNNSKLHTNGTPIYQISEDLYNTLKISDVEKITLQSNIKEENSIVNNVIGFIPGKDHTKAIIITAHLDHVGYAGKIIFRGVADNASGCAVLLKVASILKKEANNKQFSQDIVFAVLNGEESGLTGSKALVSKLKSKYKNFYNVNVDTVGMKQGGKIILEGDDNFNKKLKIDLSKYISNKGIETDIHSLGLTSDNISFEEQNICAVNIGQANVEFLHSEKDTIETLDINFLKKISEAIVQFILQNDDVMYLSESENNSSTLNSLPLSPEASIERDKYVEEQQGSLNFDEFKVLNFKGTNIVIGGSIRPLDLSALKSYYPTMKIPMELNGFIFDSLKLSTRTVAVNQDGEEISLSDKMFILNTPYKRDISKEHFIRANVLYKNSEEKLSILIRKERSDIRNDKSFDLTSFERLNIDNEYYIKKADNHISILKLVTINLQKFTVEISVTLISSSEYLQKTEIDLYEYQKNIDYENLIKQIFLD